MRLPTVRIRRYARGWFTSCSACRWTLRHHARPTLDLEAIAHHAGHADHAREGAR